MPAYLVELEDGRKFRVKSNTPLTEEEITAYALGQQPAQPESDQPGRVGSFASSVGRGALSVVPGTIGGVGYLTGSDTLTEAANTVEGGINRMLPVNPEYQEDLSMKIGQALGSAGGMLLTGGAAGAAGKGLALSRGLEAAQAAAKGTQLAQNVLLGTGVLQGTRGGGQAAEQYGMKGGTAYARALLGGAIEGLSERALFGMGTELAPVKKFLGDAAEKGVGGIVKAAGTEAGEEAAAQIGGNVATSVLAPYGVKTPEALAGAGEAALLGGVAGGALGGVNALMQPSPTIEGDAMVPFEQAPVAPEQPETDELGVEAFRQEMAQIAQGPNPIEPLKEITTKAAEVSVAQNEELLPATAAVIAAGGLTPAPTPSFEQLRQQMRQRLSAGERADMEEKLAQAEDEGVLADVFSEERKKAAAREDFLRRQQDLEAERQRLEDEGILGDIFTEERQRALTREQPQPEPPVVEETIPPVEPIPAVEEVPAAPIAEEQFPKVENIVAPEGEAEVGLGMEEPTVVAETTVVPQEGKFSVYPHSKGQWAVQEGDQRQFYGDNIFDTKEEAEQVSLQRQKLDQESADYQRKQQAKEDTAKAEQEAKDKPLNDYLDALDITPMQRGKLRKNLQGEEGRRSQKTGKTYFGDREKVTREMVADGYTPTTEQVPAIKEPTGIQWNRMSEKEQRDYEKKKAAAGLKTEYRLSFGGENYFVITKAEYEYAQHLVAQTQPVAEKPAAETPKNSLADQLKAAASRAEAEGIVSKASLEELKTAAKALNYPETGTKKVVAQRLVNAVGSRADAIAIRGAGVKPLPAAAAPAPEAKQPAPQRDTSKPEQMTPEESLESLLQRIEKLDGRRAELKNQNTLARGKKTKKETEARIVRDEELARIKDEMDNLSAVTEQVREASTAAKRRDPIPKEYLDRNNLAIPEGYVAEGELYIYRPEDGKEFGSTNTVVTKETKDKAAKNLRKKLGGQTNIGLDPSILKDAIAIGAFYIEGGARSFAEFSAKMISELGEAIRPFLRDIYDTAVKAANYRGSLKKEAGMPMSVKALSQANRDNDDAAARKLLPEELTVVTLRDQEDLNDDGTPMELHVVISGTEDQARNLLASDTDRADFTIAESEDKPAAASARESLGEGVLAGLLPAREINKIPVREISVDVWSGESNVIVSKEKADAALARLRRNLSQLNVGLDPTILKDAVMLGTFYLEAGARGFADFSAAMLRDFGARVQPYIRPAYDELRKRKDIDTSGMDPEEGGETAAKVEEPKTSPPPAPKEEAPKAESPKLAPVAAEEPATVPIANDPVDAQRVALGLPPIMRQTQEAYTFPQMWADAESAMAANPNRGSALVKELNDKPRTISALEDAILLRERVNRVNALDLSMVEFNNAPKGNNEVQRDNMDKAITALTELDDALNVAGTEQGRSLNARKMLARLDYSLAKMLTTLRAANDGELSEADVATVTRLQKQIADMQQKIAAAESGQAARIAEAEKVAFEAGRQEVLKDIQERAKADAEKIAEMRKRTADVQAAKKESAAKPNRWAEIREAANRRIQERQGKLYSDVLMLNAAATAADHVLIGATYIAEGVTKFADWVVSMRGNGINGSEEEMGQMFKESQAMFNGEELPAAEAPLKTKKAKAPVIERVQAIAADGEQLDPRTVYNLVVEKMKARAEASQGAKLPEMSDADLTSVIREVTADVQQYFPDITEREIRDLFSGYGKILMPSQDELSKQIRQLSALGKLASAIEDAKAQIAPLKSGPQRDKATQAIRLQQKKLARELRMSGVEYAAGEGQLRSPLDAIKARLNNQINDLALEINTRKKIQRRPSVAYDKETEDLVKLRDELKSISDEVNKPAGPTFAELVSEEMKKLDARIAELQKTLDEGKFAPKQDTTLYTQELQAKRDERDRLSKLVSKARKEAIGDVRTQDEIDRAAIKDAKDAISELERKLKEKDFKRPERRTPTETAEYKALTEEKDRLQKLVRDERLKAEGRQGMSDEQRIKLATAAIDKSMARIQEMLASGNYEVPKRVSKTPETPELKAKREARDALRKQLIELRKAKRDAAIDPIAKQIATDKKRIQTRMRKLKERMDKGDFSKPAKRQKATDEALLALQVEEEKLKEEWAKMVFERQLASRGPGKKILDATQQTLNTARAILTSVDVSAVLRQGGFIVLGNPMRGLRNLGPMFKAFSSEEFAKADKFRLQNRENYKNGLYQQSKLFLADTGKVNQMTAQEEAFMSRWIDKIPKGIKGAYLGSVLRGSQRAYTVFLNRLRADSFDAMVANLKKGSEPTPQEVKAVADYINIATGRGDLGKFNQAGTMLNTVFFAPRLVASRFQILAGYPYFTASGRTKALVLREYAKFLTGAALVYALGMLAQDDEDEPIETDPRSSDFGKIRFGDTRVDPLSGLIQATVLLSRLATGEKKTANGKIVAIRGAEVPYGADTSFDVMANFLRTKLSPIVGSAVNVLEGKNVVGDPTDVTEELQRMVIPMSFTEMKETFEAQGVPEATALTILQLFGMGVQTYTPGKK